MSWYIQIRTTVHPPTQPDHPETLTFCQVAYADEQGIGVPHVLCAHEHATQREAAACREAQTWLCKMRGHMAGCPHDEDRKRLALAQKGYAAYIATLKEALDSKRSYPIWERLSENTQRAWMAAAAAIREGLENV